MTWDVLLEFYDYRPSTESTWVPPTRSIRPSSPSDFGSRSHHGPLGSRAAGVAMAFTPIQAATSNVA